MPYRQTSFANFKLITFESSIKADSYNMRYIKCYITNLFFQKISMLEHIYIAKAIFSRVNPRKYLPPFRIDSRTVGSDRNKMIPLGLETSQIFRGDSRRRRAPRVATRRNDDEGCEDRGHAHRPGCATSTCSLPRKRMDVDVDTVCVRLEHVSDRWETTRQNGRSQCQ